MTTEEQNAKLIALIKAMQLDAEKFLIPDSDHNQDWFVNRMLWWLDGPEQREAMDEYVSEAFNEEETTMMRFLKMGQQSLDPQSYNELLHICNNLAITRKGLTSQSVIRCLNAIILGGAREQHKDTSCRH